MVASSQLKNPSECPYRWGSLQGWVHRSLDLHQRFRFQLLDASPEDCVTDNISRWISVLANERPVFQPRLPTARFRPLLSRLPEHDIAAHIRITNQYCPPLMIIDNAAF